MQTIEIAGVEVPRVGLGTNRLTEDRVDFVVSAVEAGIRHVDTAHLYTDGASERTIGAAGIAARDDVVVATKGGFEDGRPEAIGAEIEQSLRSLAVDCIDLYYLHRVDSEVDLETSLGAIKDYVERGAIRAVGISAVTVEQIERARAVVPIAAVQNEYNRANGGDDAVVDHCAAAGIVFVPFFPLRGDGTNAEKLTALLERSPAMAPIPGTLSVDHVRENLAVI